MKKLTSALVALVLVLVLSVSACAEGNPAFGKIFTDNGIFHMTNIFFMMDSDAYAIQTPDFIECMEFGYKDDMVLSYVNTVYLPVYGYSSADLATVDSNLRNAYAAVDAMEHIAITFDDVSSGAKDFYKLVVTVDGLDDPQVLRSVVETGLLALTSDNYTYLSMAQTDIGLQANGYVKR